MIDNCGAAPDHHLFLGASVRGFSAQAGWSDQIAEVDIQLVVDSCAAPDTSPKIYYNNYLERKTTTLADVGFLGEVVEICGAPAYFRFGNFEFAGIIKSWERQNSASENPGYSVKLVSPVSILEQTILIIDKYNGPLLPGGLFQEAPNNLINVYGFIEGVDGSRAPQFYQSEPGLYLEGDGGIDGAVFGTSAGAFGGARLNDNGIQWNILKNAINVLTSAVPKVANDWSPHGRCHHKGISIASIPSAYAECYGLMCADNIINSQYVSEYCIDISELPSVPSYFRFSGPHVSLLDVITRICQESGFDYFIELCPIKSLVAADSGIAKLIKIRTVSRVVQPETNQIQNFVDNQTKPVISKSIGRELRDDITSSFMFGAPKDTIYQAYQKCNPEGLDNPPLSGIADMVVPYVGINSFGNMIVPRRAGSCNDWTYWLADFETFDLNNNLALTDVSGLTISNEELEAALSSFETWDYYTDYFITDSYRALSGSNPEGLEHTSEINLQQIEKRVARRIADANNNGIVFHAWLPRDINNAVNAVSAIRKQEFDVFSLAMESWEKDKHTVFKFVETIAQTFYGKTWAIRVPHVSAYFDDESRQIYYSEEPGQDGGWTEVNNVLGLSNPGTTLNFFTKPNNKILPFLYFPIGIDLSYVKTDSFIVDDGNFYVKADVAPEYVFHNKLNLDTPRIVMATQEPIAQALDDLLKEVGGLDQLLQFTNPELTAEQRDEIRFQLFSTVTERTAYYKIFGAATNPSGIACPIHSNTLTYGPWSVVGPAGGTKVEQQNGLAPWEYGSYSAMNTAGQTLVEAGLTNMQVGEVGNVTVAGYPDLPLGAELNSADILNGQHLVENRTEHYDNFNGSMGDVPFNYQFLTQNNGFVLLGNYGPCITNITVNAGDNVSTSYSMRTFTPKFGRFSELNAYRLRQIGQEKLRGKKLLAAALERRVHNIVEENKDFLRHRLNHVVSEATSANRRFLSHTPHEVLVGQLALPNTGTGIMGGRNSNSLPRTVVGSYSIADLSSTYSNFGEKAFMSMDGLVRPISMGGDGGLPRFITPSGSGSGTATTYRMNLSGDIVGVITSGSTTIKISDLNPFANPQGYKFSDIQARQTGGSYGHDIDMIGRSTPSGDFPSGGLVMLSKNSGTVQDYQDDYRGFALRGPVLVHGWGFDTDGKPIPNSVDTVEAASSGIFKTSGLTDNFLEGFLQRPNTWAVAPIDLRLDKGRGVWTLANSEPEVWGQLLSHLDSSQGVRVKLLDSGTKYYDTSGHVTGFQVISGFTRTENVYGSGCNLKFKYNTALARYEANQSSDLLVLITGTINKGTWDRNITGFTPTLFSAPLFVRHHTSGGSFSYSTGNLVTGWNPYATDVTVSAGQAKIGKLVNCFLDNVDCSLVTI